MMDAQQDKKRPIFDPTINLGHVLTFCGFIATGFAAYSTLDKRVAVIEQRAIALEQRSTEQDARIKEALSDIRSDLRDVKRGVDDIVRSKK